jgi:beta-glucosidase
VKSGQLDEKHVDRAVGRVLRVKFELGLFENPYRGSDMPENAVHSDEAVALSREIADEAIVLLKNENRLLPLNIDGIRSLAVIGPNAGQVQFGDYTWSRSNADGVTPLEGIKKLAGDRIKIRYARGCDLVTDDTSGFGEAVAAAQASELSIVFAGTSSASLARDYSGSTSGEGFDLSSLELTGVQSDLIKRIHAVGKPVVLVLVTGKPFAIPWMKEHLPAIVIQWYGGEKAGDAIAAMLFGHTNPSARLPFSFPQSTGHLPAFYNHLPTDKGFYHRPGSPGKPGRDYVFSSPAPLWAFGYGLSYTSFEYLDMQVSPAGELHPSDTLTVQVTLKNSGPTAGKEVVQLYFRDVVSSTVTPVRQLKAFAKPFLHAGETQTVELRLPVQEFALYDLHMNRIVEAGDFELQVGGSSDDIKLKTTVCVGGLNTPAAASGHTEAPDRRDIAANPGKAVTVKGTVRDVQATPVAGASIRSNYSGNTATSDGKGRYSIESAENDVLTVSAPGFETLNIGVNKAESIDVKLDYIPE